MKRTPPKRPLQFLRWFCREDYLDEIEGDLIEFFLKQAETNPRQAKWRFTWSVIKYFRPEFMKSFRGYQPNAYGMYKSYFKIGWRNLTQNRGYSAINIAGLALSITCGIFIFFTVSYNLSFDNFHPNSDCIYRIVTEKHRDVISYDNSVPSPLGELFRRDYTYGEKVARIFIEREVLITLKNQNELIKYKEPEGIAFTEVSFFDIFNFPLLQGNQRTVLTEPNTAILTERMANKYFGNKNPIGETFWLQNKLPFTVTGVLKNLPTNTDFKSEVFLSYSSLSSYNAWLASDTDGWGGIQSGMNCYVRLRPHTSISQVEEVLSAYVKIHRPNSRNIHRYKLQPLADIHFNAQYGGAVEKSNLWILSAIGIFLLITACVNFVNLATAQALKRSKEVGVRKVLGSQKRQIFWQFVFETGMITFAGIVASVIISYTTFPLLNGFFETEININLLSGWPLVIFILTIGVVVTFLACFYPGLVLSRFQPVIALKGKLSQQSIDGFNTRCLLIVAQFTISQVLIIGMIVIMNQMHFAKETYLGFDKDGIVMIQAGRDSTGTSVHSLKNEILRIGGVEKLSLCYAAPSSDYDKGNTIKFDNSSEEVNFRTSIKAADADYVSTFNLELIAGRNLLPSDSLMEVLVNETMIHKLNIKSPEEAIGRLIWAAGGKIVAPIVGVVKDFHDRSFHEEISPILITTYNEDYSNYAVKINLANAKSILSTIEKLWSEQYPDQLFQYEFLDESIGRFYEAEESTLKLMKAFSFIAIFIGCLGLYGLVSFMTTQKVKEISIRKILGGSEGHIAWLFGKEFIRLIMIAFLLAAPLGWWLMQNWLKNFKFQVHISALTFVWAIGCSLIIASLTVGYQVMKMAFVNPVNNLKSD